MTTRPRLIGKLWTIDELAEHWQVSPRTVERLIKSRALRARRIGRLVRITNADAEDFLDQNEDE
jgi:excisionase family DNA binding protein